MHSPIGTVGEKRMDNLLIWTYSFSVSLSCCACICVYVCLCLCVWAVSMCTCAAEGREGKRINDCNKWRWTFQGLCALPVFFSIFLSPTAKYVLISMHIYNLHWTSESPVFSEVIGLLCGAESTISNTHRIANPSFKLWWYKAFICNFVQAFCTLGVVEGWFRGVSCSQTSFSLFSILNFILQIWKSVPPSVFCVLHALPHNWLGYLGLFYFPFDIFWSFCMTLDMSSQLLGWFTALWWVHIPQRHPTQ